MKTYIRTQIIQAEPMTEHCFTEKFEGIEIPGYRVIFSDGHASWLPEKLFEATHREISYLEKEEEERLQAARREEE